MTVLTNFEFTREQQPILASFAATQASICNEISSFSTKMQTLTADFSLDYQKFLLTLLASIDIDDDESVVLEQVIPLWSQERGKSVPADKPIDQFYFEFEMLSLWECLLKFANDTSNQAIIINLRKIIRRYSNLPELWQHLCKISGDDVQTSYTF